jgi:Domain of unknown function (DUF4333)
MEVKRPTAGASAPWRRRRALGITLSSVSILALTGCGSLNDAEIEDAVKRELEKNGADVRSVECPKDLEPKRGNKFTCTAIGTDDTRLAVPVTQQDDEGNVAFNVPLLNPKTLEEDLRGASEELAVAGGAAKNTAAATRCPELTAPKPRESVVCSLTFSDGSSGLGHLKLDAQGKPEVARDGKHLAWKVGER